MATFTKNEDCAVILNQLPNKLAEWMNNSADHQTALTYLQQCRESGLDIDSIEVSFTFSYVISANNVNPPVTANFGDRITEIYTKE